MSCPLLLALCLTAAPPAVPPLAAYDRLGELNAGPVPPLPPAERTLLALVSKAKAIEPAAAVRLTDGQAADLLLFASGVEDPAARGRYRGKLDTLTADVAAAVNGHATARAKGEALMTALHATAFAKGYAADQTTVSGVFDTGTMNCVSSAAVYAYVGGRLGLTLTAVGIPGRGGQPGHAALDLLDGPTRVEVEPTNPDGFDWPAKIRRPGVRVVGAVPDRTAGRATDLPGLAAMIYSNRGNALSKAARPNRLASVRANLSGLCLDPGSPTAAHNLSADFANWGADADKAGDHGLAVRVLGFGAGLFPDDALIRGNRAAAFAGAVRAALAAGRDADAVRLLDSAQAAVPEDGDFADPAKWFQVVAQQQPAGDYAARLAVYDRGVKALPAKAAADLSARRAALYREWSQDRLAAGDATGSLAALAEGFDRHPADPGLRAGLAYHTQEALKLLDDGGPAAAAAHVAELKRRFPQADEVGRVAAGHAGRAVHARADAGKYAEALTLADAYKPLLAGEHPEAVARVYDAWGRKLAAGKEWAAAVDKYRDGAKAAPAIGWLRGNAEAVVDQWAEPAMAAADWAAAVTVYDAGLARFPDSKHLAHNRAVCVGRQKAGG